MDKDHINLINKWNQDNTSFFNCVHNSPKYSWRTQFISKLKKIDFIENGDFYQLGVYSGASIKLVVKKLEDIGVSFRRIYGFDSFKGLPKETEDIKYNPKNWNEGRFDMSNLGDIETIKNKIIDFVENDNLSLIDGFFENTLNQNNVEKYNMKKATYIDMDCDIYSSTVSALEFFIKNKLLVKGTIIGYDDWSMGNVDLNEFKGGQSRAHIELCKKYDIIFKRLKNFKLWKERAVFIVEHIEYE